MDNSRVLLFVILGGSRSVSAMCEAAYHVGRRAKGGGANGGSGSASEGKNQASVVLCVQKIKEGAEVDGPGRTLSR